MKTTPIDNIDPETLNRQRTVEFGAALDSLQSSIRDEGLFHAIIVTPLPSEHAGEEGVPEYRLVAGYNRLQAVHRLAQANKQIYYDGLEVPLWEVPFTVTHKTDEVSLFRIELEENLRREALSPTDEASAIARLHNLLKKYAPEIVPGLQENITFKDTAQVLIELKGDEARSEDYEATRVSESILIEAYKDDPGVKKAKTHTAAAAAARKAAAREFQQIYGQITAGEVSEDERHQVILGSCQVVLPTLPEASVDVIIADPPYGVGADTFGEQSLGHEYKDDADAFNQVFNSILKNCSRVCKPDAAMFIFCDISTFHAMTLRPTQLSAVGAKWYEDWYIWPTPLIWHKTNRGHAPQPKRGPSRQYEAILYATRGERTVRKVGSDILSFPVPDARLHAAGKPIDLYTELLSWIAYPGDCILDPCAGSGTVIHAANRLDCRSIAIEKDEGFAALCREATQKGEKDEEV